MKLHDLMSPTQLEIMMDKDYIRLQVHPSEPLGILNYTDKASWDGEWNDVTMTCRGLIYDMTNYDVIARPFKKFYNYEQFGTEYIFPDGPVRVTDKKDGSMGILYPLPDGSWAVATRGLFTSDQALHATKLFNEKYAADLTYDPDITYLFEIIYPENRIVLNYGDMDDMILLGGVVISNGFDVSPDTAQHLLGWTGPVTETFPAATLTEAMMMAPRENAEGIVVYFKETGLRIKMKQADYVALHRLVTGLTDRYIWEALGQGKTVDQIKEPLPEEFYAWVDEVANDLRQKQDQILMAVWDEFNNVVMSLPSGFTRKDFALVVKDHPQRAYLFKYLDEQPIADVVWRSLKPSAVRSMTNATEED